VNKLQHRLYQYALLIRLNKPIGILLLLWPTLWGLWIAGNGKPDLYVVAVFTLGVFLMRSAGCAINDFADRHIDGQVQRTHLRPLATGKIQPYEALLVAAILSLVAFALVLSLNRLTIQLSFIALLLAAIYPFMKRFTHLPQVVLGIAFSWSIPMAFAALTHQVPAMAWWLFAAACIWPVIYDTEYAMADREEDKQIGVKSTAILFATYDRLIIGVLQIVFLGLLISIGQQLHKQWPYYCGLSIIAALFIYQQYLIRHREATSSFQAFLNNNYVGATLFIALLFSN
jgi:4-hydroxybenzoate polyprenyltransferase